MPIRIHVDKRANCTVSSTTSKANRSMDTSITFSLDHGYMLAETLFRFIILSFQRSANNVRVLQMFQPEFTGCRAWNLVRNVHIWWAGILKSSKSAVQNNDDHEAKNGKSSHHFPVRNWLNNRWRGVNDDSDSSQPKNLRFHTSACRFSFEKWNCTWSVITLGPNLPLLNLANVLQLL